MSPLTSFGIRAPPGNWPTAVKQQFGVRAETFRAHIGEADQVQGLIMDVTDALGGLDILINNAASGVQRTVMDLEANHWNWTLDINARGPWLAAKYAVPHMLARRRWQHRQYLERWSKPSHGQLHVSWCFQGRA